MLSLRDELDEAEQAAERAENTRPQEVTADDIITRIMQAPDETAALAALDGVPRSMLMTLADQLYIDAQGRSSAVVRRAIAKEARA